MERERDGEGGQRGTVGISRADRRRRPACVCVCVLIQSLQLPFGKMYRVDDDSGR